MAFLIKMENGVVYAITNTINGWVYFGSTIHEKQRLSRHIRHLRKNKHFNKRLQADFNEYGEECFTIEVIERGIHESALHFHERSLIVCYASENNDRVYNTSRTPRISEAKRKQLRRQMNAHAYEQLRLPINDFSSSFNQ